MKSSPEEPITVWIEQLKAGDQEAARNLWDRYFDRLVRQARKRMRSAPRRVADEEDVALSVFDSLCRGAERGHFTELADREDLWKLLLAITRQKAASQLRHQGRQKRGGGQVRGESVFVAPGEGDRQVGLDGFLDDEPTPEFLALLDEEHRRLIDLLPDATLRQVALWKLEGFTTAEMADKLGMTTRSVERKLRLIRETWSGEVDQ